MIRLIACYMLLKMLGPCVSTAQKPAFTIHWKKIAAIPSCDEGEKSLGFAGTINGVTNHVFIVAGGSNFPNGLPWQGGQKSYSDKIFVLEKRGKEFTWNHQVKEALPEPIAYCGSTSTPSGIIYVGGENEKGISRKCFLLKWKEPTNHLDIRVLPDLPVALTNVSVTNIGMVVYAVGGDKENHSSKNFFSLDLNQENPYWKTLPDLPVPLANATAITQKGKDGEEIFIIGGRTKTPSGISDLHNTLFVFNLKKEVWTKGAAISDGTTTTHLDAASGVALGKNEILITGFDNGKVFHQIEILIAKIAKAKTPEEKENLTKEKNRVMINHRGFDKRLLLYNTLSNTWTCIGELPFPAHVTTTDVKWGNAIVISNGEIKPGVRTPNIMIGKVNRSNTPAKKKSYLRK